MSDGRNALKPPRDHIDFNLKLKIILSPLFDAQKSCTWNFWFFGLICSVRQKIQGDKRIEIMSQELHFVIHQFSERKVTIAAFISNAGRLNMISNFDNILIIVAKWKYSSFYRFRPTLKSFCDYFKNHCEFYKIQIITTKRILVFAFNCNIVHVWWKPH